MHPVVLAPNQPDLFYRGGESIADFRGTPLNSVYQPEDWIGSTTAIFGTERPGRTVLGDGTLLLDAIAADPIGYLGAEHVAAYGSDSGLLVKLLDAGERLPVHLHPPRGFAESYLGCAHGKTEAWLVVGTSVPHPEVYVGFREAVSAERVHDMVQKQRPGELLESLTAFPVQVGDAVFVPAGTPHSISAGVFIVELQEPTDFSIMMEFARYGIDGGERGTLGLGFDKALDCVDRRGWSDEEVAKAHGPGWAADGTPRKNVLPPEADAFFRAERIQPEDGASVVLEASFGILIAVDGSGTLETESGALLNVSKGDTLLVPYSAGPSTVSGPVTVLRCQPPATPVGG